MALCSRHCSEGSLGPTLKLEQNNMSVLIDRIGLKTPFIASHLVCLFLANRLSLEKLWRITLKLNKDRSLYSVMYVAPDG